jgi:zinc protease
MKHQHPFLQVLIHTALTALGALSKSLGRLLKWSVAGLLALGLPMAGAQQFTLSNGMTLLVKPDHRSPTAVHMLWVRVGSMDEVDGTSGVAHLLEHMMFKGTPTVKAGDFSRKVAAMGGRENAFTSKDYTGYFQQIPAARLPDVMQLEADRFANNQWSDEDFRKELEVVKEERRLRTEDNPHARLHEAMEAVQYQASPYRRPIVGWMSDLEAMTPSDARAFYQRWYTPANAAVVVAGDVDAEQVRVWAEKYYGPIPQRALAPRKPRAEPEQSGIRRLDFKAPAEQAYVALAFKVPSLSAQGLEASGTGAADDGSNDALALTVLAAVLDGFDGARLERALTQPKDHVADSAGAHSGLSARGPQTFMLYGVPASGKTAAQVETALRAEVARVARDGVQESELARVKTQWVAGEVYKLDSVFNQGRILGVNWINGLGMDADERLIARLRGVTAQQVQAVAAKYFGDDALTVATLLPQPLDKNRKPRVPMAGARH